MNIQIHAPLTITPNPDSMLRVFMVFKSLGKEIDITPQEIKSFNRMDFLLLNGVGLNLNNLQFSKSPYIFYNPVPILYHLGHRYIN